MSHRITYAMPPDARAKLIALFPRITPINLMRFDDMVAADRLLTDDGKPTQAFTEWVERVLTK